MSKSQEPIMYLSKKVWEHSEKKSKVILYIIMFSFSNVVLLLFPLLIAQIVNTIQLEGLTQTSIYTILFWIAGYLVLDFAFWGLHGPARWIETINAFKVKANYKLYLLQGVMGLPSSWHANHQSGDTIDKIEKGTKALYEFAEMGFMVVASLMKLTGATIILFFFNVPAGFITMLLILATIIIVIKFDKKLIREFHQLNVMDNHISAKVYDTISNITTVIILRLESLLTKSLTTKIMHPLPLFKQNIKFKEIKWFTVSTLATLMIVLTLSAYILTHFRSGEVILIGSLMALYQYVETINNIFFHFTYRYGEIVKQKTDVENAEILAKDFRNKSKVQQIKLQNTTWNTLKISKLKFFYEEPGVLNQKKRKPITLSLKDITIHKGEKIALVGESGAGKTTFLKLIRDLYTPQEADIFLDDQKLKKGFKEVASSISLIPQDPEIFASTIQDNITFGIRKSRTDITRFTDTARFTDVIPTLPHGLKSSINERGVNLSGGQKQRLALARGLMASESKEIILLDEPTSSVDSHNELNIYQEVLKKFKQKTIISSMHRLHLLPFFDTIFYFDGGKIVQTGSLEQLLRTNKKFRTLWNKYKNED
ncbi:hypothetical protein CL619_01980 [archaeon]|nr:hypothetical protein [archaeon]